MTKQILDTHLVVRKRAAISSRNEIAVKNEREGLNISLRTRIVPFFVMAPSMQVCGIFFPHFIKIIAL